jgi:hypothetical protein
VIPAASTREYAGAVPGARAAVVPRTGHIGIVTRPAAWASVVGGFVREVAGVGQAAGLARAGRPVGAERAAPDRAAVAPDPCAGARM